MVILTAATSEVDGKQISGKQHTSFSFKSVIQSTVKNAETYGYKTVVYDLNNLGIGQYYDVKNEYFLSNGHYKREVVTGHKTRALFKPEIVKKCLTENNDLVVYLDGDAQLNGNIDDINSGDYDIGVTLREPIEIFYQKKHGFESVNGFVNAGVLFFNNTENSMKFVDKWILLTRELGNDQLALNQLLPRKTYPKKFSTIKIDGIKIKYFPARTYNYYYFKNIPYFGAKIFHFKSDVRTFYPFNFWKKFKNLFFHTPVGIVIKLLRPPRQLP
ncbi:MAG: hypothetical protein C0616_09435 [Desulfuromonas sp.]|nr:MAG: hypothetical protein C0616_09435 [Desulfuromonas sp.]